MLGLKIRSKTNINRLQLNIPDELKGIDLQIIILPVVDSKNEEIKFFTETELKKLHTVNLGTSLKDDEGH